MNLSLRPRCLRAPVRNGSLVPWMLVFVAACVAATFHRLRVGGPEVPYSESPEALAASDVSSGRASDLHGECAVAPSRVVPQGAPRTRAEAATDEPIGAGGTGAVRIRAMNGVAGWPPVIDIYATDSSSPIVEDVDAQPFHLPVGNYCLRVRIPYRLAIPCEFRVVADVLTDVQPELARVHSWVIADFGEGLGAANDASLFDNHGERREVAGRVLLLRFVTDPQDDLRLRVLPDVFECSPARLPWDCSTHAVAVTLRPTLQVAVRGQAVCHRMRSMQRVVGSGAAWRMTSWQLPDGAIPRLVPPDGEVRVVLDTSTGFFGPVALNAASGMLQSVDVPGVATVALVREAGSQPVAAGRLLIGGDACVDVLSDVVTKDNLARYEPAKWLLCQEFSWSDGLTESLPVFRGVPFAVEVAERDGRVTRHGPYRVDAERATITLAAGFVADVAVRVRVRAAPDMRKPVRVLADARDGDPLASVIVPIVDPDKEANFRCPTGEQVVITGQYQHAPDGPWLAFDSAVVERQAGEVDVLLDATHLPVAPRAGVLAGVLPRPGGMQVAFHPIDGRLAVVGGLEMPGHPRRRSGNLVADVDDAGRFMLEVGLGTYEVHVTDPFGRDVGMRSVRLSVDDALGQLFVGSGPRDVVLLMPAVAAGRAVCVHGPDGVSTATVDEQARLALHAAACGEYRVFDLAAGDQRLPIAVFQVGSDGAVVAGKKP